MYGLPPFYNKNQTIMFKLIKEGELRFPERPETSKEAKDFIQRVVYMSHHSYLLEIGLRDWVLREISRNWLDIHGLRMLIGNY